MVMKSPSKAALGRRGLLLLRVLSPAARTRQQELATARHKTSVFKKLRTTEACWGSAPFLPFLQYRLPCPRNGPIPTLAESFLHQSSVTMSLTGTARCSRFYPVDNTNQHNAYVLFSAFIAGIDTMTEATLGKKERASFSLQFHITGRQRGKSRNELKPDRHLKAGTETDALEGHYLLDAQSPVSWALRHSASTKKKMHLRLAEMPVRWGCFLRLGSLFPNDSSFCKSDIQLSAQYITKTSLSNIDFSSKYL